MMSNFDDSRWQESPKDSGRWSRQMKTNSTTVVMSLRTIDHSTWSIAVFSPQLQAVAHDIVFGRVEDAAQQALVVAYQIITSSASQLLELHDHLKSMQPSEDDDAQDT